VLRHWEGAPATTRHRQKGDDGSLGTWDNFAAYCWPVSEELFVMWDPDPDNWKPINHSCNPNAWNQEGNGLNVVARYPVRAGEEVRMDYATFVGYFPDMKSFECGCGAADCRGLVTGLDIVTHPSLAKRYHGHMTSYIASKVREEPMVEDGEEKKSG
jgi:hypothetical protein